MSSTTSSDPLLVTCEALRRACSRFATGVAIVTTIGPDGTPHGLTVNSFTSISCEPPIVGICIDFRCSVLPALCTASHFGINILEASQREISIRFAQVCDQRFDGIEWEPTVAGVPRIAGIIGFLECRRRSSTTIGDHEFILGEVEVAEAFEGSPLLYFASQYAGLA